MRLTKGSSTFTTYKVISAIPVGLFLYVVHGYVQDFDLLSVYIPGNVFKVIIVCLSLTLSTGNLP